MTDDENDDNGNDNNNDDDDDGNGPSSNKRRKLKTFDDKKIRIIEPDSKHNGDPFKTFFNFFIFLYS